MTRKNVWSITGTGRGMGVDLATATLAAGATVVGTFGDLSTSCAMEAA